MRAELRDLIRETNEMGNPLGPFVLGLIILSSPVLLPFVPIWAVGRLSQWLARKLDGEAVR